MRKHILSNILINSELENRVYKNGFETRSVENSDLDEIFLIDSTRQTFTIENTDIDDFRNVFIKESYNEDYDDILFI